MRQILLGTVGCLLSLPILWSQHHSITTVSDKVGAKPTGKGRAGLKPTAIYNRQRAVITSFFLILKKQEMQVNPLSLSTP